MKISAKGQYAVRLMVEIAKSKEKISISNIAKSQDISPKYLEQIVSKLVKANLLESTRGHMGGYFLTKDASQISIKTILDTTGDTTELAPCLNGDCSRKCKCDTMGVWFTLNNLINNYLENVTLKDLVDKTFQTTPKYTG